MSTKKLVVPPLNFAIIENGIFRSGYPNKKNFDFLKTLGLRSILYMCEDNYSQDNLDFFQREGIKVFQFRISGNKEPFQEIDQKEMTRVLETVLDKANHPILVHCNKGKHRVGCLVGCLRKFQKWSNASIFDEYRRFAGVGSKLRIADQEFIELFSVNGMKLHQV